MAKSFLCALVVVSVAALVLTSGNFGYAVTINPGGVATLGTVHYLNENVALGTHSGGNALPDVGGVYVSPAASASFGNPNGSNGNNGDTVEGAFSGIGVYTGGSPMLWRANLASRAGTPNLGNQSYAISQIGVYGRSNSGTSESDAFITVLEQGSPAAAANALLADFPNAGPVLFNFSGNSLIGQRLQYVSRVPNGIGAYSFSEIQAQGQQNLVLAGDTLNIEISPTGNDYVNIQGSAQLNGVLSVTTFGGPNLAGGGTFNLLTADSISLSGLTFDGLDIAGLRESLSIIAGGQGQILQLNLTAIPEPSTFALAVLGGMGLVHAARRRRRA